MSKIKENFYVKKALLVSVIYQNIPESYKGNLEEDTLLELEEELKDRGLDYSNAFDVIGQGEPGISLIFMEDYVYLGSKDFRGYLLHRGDYLKINPETMEFSKEDRYRKFLCENILKVEKSLDDEGTNQIHYYLANYIVDKIEPIYLNVSEILSE